MWSDSEDFLIISDMYQINIKIITSKGPDDKKPRVSWIYPDLELKKFAELKNVQLNDLVLFHEYDSHFDLVIPMESDLVKLGSLSNRYNVGPMMEDSLEEENKTKENNEDNEESDMAKLKKELKECKEGKKKIEVEYYKCERELKLKTEECEKQKIEIKDLKQIIELTETLTENVNHHSIEKPDSKSDEKETEENPWVRKTIQIFILTQI